jgi:anti-sigma factor RsiW
MMHDCRTAQERLIDLVFKELDDEQSLRLLQEIEACPECQEQHRSMSLTLFAFDQATSSMLPPENYWSDYHEKLERRLDAAVAAETGTPQPSSVVPLWKRFVNTSIRVPAPVAALALLLLAGSSLFALMRPSSATLAQAVPPASVPADERTRIVEVPVVQEKVLTRTIYVARNNRAKDEMVKDERDRRGVVPQLAIEERGPDAPATQTVQDVPASNARDAGDTMQSTHAALAGFKPAGEVKLRIIKGTYRDEK